VIGVDVRLMTSYPRNFEKWLKAAQYEAALHLTVNFDLALHPFGVVSQPACERAA
jgi:hypothetical protein